MSATTIAAERGARFRSTGLAWLNGAMAVLCGLMAALLAVVCAGLLLISLSVATAWPRGGFDVALPGDVFHFKVASGTTTVNSDTCTITDGRRTCSRVTRTSVSPPSAGSLITAAALLPIGLPLAALAYGLGHAAACFTALSRRRWFARGTITHLRDFALGGLMFQALTWTAIPLARGVDDLSALWLPHGATRTPGAFNLDLGPLPAFLTVVYAVALALITAVLAHARAVAEDHAQIV